MPATDLDLLLAAARDAGEIAMSHWREDPETETKSDGTPVSEADIEVDTDLRRTLTAARPGYGWLSEETPDDPARLDRERCFIVDPIDGTRAYLSGQENWALSLAVASGGTVTDAVIHMPAKGLTYVAGQGQGARLIVAGDAKSALSVTATAGAEGARLITSKGTYADRHWRDGVPGFSKHFRPSMAYRLAVVAQGRFDAMITLRDAWEWDIAAGVLIAAEAGATVTDRRGAALRFNSPGRQTDGVLAANPALHGEILSRLA
ncbi:myo-inositol-1(or 4)-monophosphatase [Palleronia salina]|uniref:Myo-inositol-1(Or 4)-monophosphatase n=1 Tax=Palleronia salina TaxID=313368 RepID=A0A1M6E9S5_9RHOB|nr:3'(2'),5'-bisphosphate nucleotidase CysQ [Palleronia salina]SHI82222.1 myo-inositol-1(or 4)-monophosphatase [Palleronia salina]